MKYLQNLVFRGGKSIGLLLLLFLLLGNGGVWAQVLSIDFEDATSTYTDWTFVNITSKATNENVIAHGGKYFGNTSGEKTASVTTKTPISSPVNLTFYVSKQSKNSTSSTWKVEVSSDGTKWNTIKEQSATSMTRGEWVEVSQDLKTYKDVYVRISFSTTTTAIRCIDDVTLTYESGSSITALDVTYAADILKGDISYTINNAEGSTLKASVPEGSWVSNLTVDEAKRKVTFDMTENLDETKPREETITLAYGELTKYVKVTQLAAVAKRTVTIETPENGTLKVYRGEEEVTSGSLIPQGTELKVEATANEGYKFRNWQAVDGSTHTFTTNFTYTIGESDVTFSANFDKIVYHTITWSVNGVETTKQVEEGTAITFATPTENIPEGYVFKGWYGSTLEPQDVAPEYVTSAIATADFTYYAVFAKGEGSEPSLVKMTMNDDFIDGDKVVIVAKVDDTTSYGLYQETIGNTYVKNFVFTNDVNNIANDDKNWWTVSDGATANDGKWKLGDETNGYLNTSGSNDLNVVVDGTTEWTLEKDENSGFFKIKGGSDNKYISCRSDLTGDNKYRYRMAGGTPNGIYTFDIYKYISGSVVYSDFRTSVTAPSTVTITIAEACTDGNGMYYGTYSNSKAFVVPSDIIVSEISVIDNKLVVENYETGAIVPANTGVMVSSNTAGNHDVELSEAAGTSVLGNDNMLRPTGDNGITAEEMAANDANCKYYRLTMHKGTTLGFFYGAADGAAFNVAANKAYLAVPAETAAKVSSFVIGGGSTTAIDGIEAGNGANASRKVYNLQGQRVSGTLPKGLYIIDGRKVIVK